METIRAFIAIELPDEIRTELGVLQKSLKTGEQNYVKWVSPDSIHLTLKFLGDIDADKVEEITGAVRESIEHIPPFILQIKGLGVFPNLRRIQVIWVGLTGNLDSLQLIQKNIEENLAILGYPEEARDFTPHLTLGRVRFQPPPEELQKFGQLLTSTNFESAFKIGVESINLMKSELTPHGAIYTQLSSVNLRRL